MADVVVKLEGDNATVVYSSLMSLQAGETLDDDALKLLKLTHHVTIVSDLENSMSRPGGTTLEVEVLKRALIELRRSQ